MNEKSIYMMDGAITDTIIFNPLAIHNDYTLYQRITWHDKMLEEMVCYIAKEDNPHDRLSWKEWHESSEALQEWKDYLEEYLKEHGL